MTGGQLQAVDARAVDRMDLLTVVEHELGHAAGLRDLDPSLADLMSSSLGQGIRRQVSASDVDAVFAGVPQREVTEWARRTDVQIRPERHGADWEICPTFK